MLTSSISSLLILLVDSYVESSTDFDFFKRDLRQFYRYSACWFLWSISCSRLWSNPGSRVHPLVDTTRAIFSNSLIKRCTVYLLASSNNVSLEKSVWFSLSPPDVALHESFIYSGSIVGFKRKICILCQGGDGFSFCKLHLSSSNKMAWPLRSEMPTNASAESCKSFNARRS